MTRLAVLFAGLFLLGTASDAIAGGGPERVLVVVNADSPASLQVANAYVRLRGIPPEHICRVRGIPTLRVISVAEFRERLWPQVLNFLKEQGLGEEIDTIAWSVDFPYGVDFKSDVGGVSGDNRVPRIAALTGMTYLWRRVMEKDTNYENLQVNKYFRSPGFQVMEGHGFDAGWRWTLERDPDPAPDESALDRYHLSTLLGFTGEQGNTLPEILEGLTRSAGADGSQPEGTVYLMSNKDVRSTTREPTFKSVIELLAQLGGKAEVLTAGVEGQDGKVPVGRTDAIGVVAGIAGFEWPQSSKMLPGCIAEHLTSFGAMFNGSGQTKLSAFLRAGAAGSSGTVAEPLAIPNKFPAAYLHAYYRQGCSLAESFYQSVWGPYQLLIVGDPLVRPYARFAEVSLTSPDPAAPWSGTVTLKSECKEAPGRPLGLIEAYVDGQRLARARVGEELALDTLTLDDGSHELRLVAIEDTRVGTRTSSLLRFEVKNGANSVSLKGPRTAEPLGEDLELTGKVSAPATVKVFRGAYPLAEVKARGSFKVKLPAALLGPGESALFARAEFAEGPAARSEAVDVRVEVPAPGGRKPKRKPAPRKKDAAPAKGQQGLRATVVTQDGKEHQGVIPTLGALGGDNRFFGHLGKIAGGPYKSIRLEGEVHAAVAGEYEFVLQAQGTLSLEVAQVELLQDAPCDATQQAYAMVALPEGWHAITLSYVPSGNGDLSILLSGAQVAQVLAGDALRQ